MHVKSFEISGLLGQPQVISANLNGDLNILTGRNGSGKTSILKLLWYIVSGNILLALQEVAFSRIAVVTDGYACTVHRLSKNTCRVEMEIDGKVYMFEDDGDGDDDDGHPFSRAAEDKANPHLIERGASVFFPTFRRIEGGFTLSSARTLSSQPGAIGLRSARPKNDIEDAMIALSKKLTNGQHIFVSSISTADIVEMLLARYADLSGRYAVVQQRTSSGIIERIKEFRSDREDVQKLDTANEVLDKIREQIERMERTREQIMTPIEAVRSLVQQLFRHAGIKIGGRLSFGDAANAVNSDALSAGEKQMLSFICYNAFNKNGVVFIDEPELSLHVDWQRQLFPILLGQQSSNQFIIATHSPFIYSKYPEKEIGISLERGDEES